MEHTCPVCSKPYDGVFCTACTTSEQDANNPKGKDETGQEKAPTAYLVDLVSNRKIPVPTPRCKAGRDDLNDIVISGDQSISRFHFVISKEGDQFHVQDSKSRHGTFLNGNQITNQEPINDGDVLKVGVSLFWFVIESASGQSSESTPPVDLAMSKQASAMAQKEGSVQGELRISTSAGRSHRVYDPSNLTATSDNIPAFVPDSSLAASLGVKPIGSNKFAIPSNQEKTIPPGSFKPGADLSVLIQDDPLDDLANEPIVSNNEHDAADSGAIAEAKSTDEKATSENATAHDQQSESEAAIQAAGSDLDKISKKYTEREFDRFAAEPDQEVLLTTEMLLNPLHLSEEVESTPVESSETKSEDSEPKNEMVQPKDVVEEVKSSEPEEVTSVTTQEAKAAPESVSEAVEAAEGGRETNQEVVAQTPSEAVAETLSNGALHVNGNGHSPESTGKEEIPAVDGSTDSATAATLGKFAEIIGEAATQTDTRSEIQKHEIERAAELSNLVKSGILPGAVSQDELADDGQSNPSKNLHENGHEEGQGTNGANGMNMVKESGPVTVPEWCNKYFAGEINQLGRELSELNEQVKLAQQKIRDVEGRVSHLKGLRNTLLTAQGEDLVESCSKVLSFLGWRTKISDDDRQELKLETDDRFSIARVVWTTGQAERTHLGQLSISQTRYWCEQGAEPKGILIISRVGDQPPAPLSALDYNSELADYAARKNVCLMTTVQLLAIYRDVYMNDANPESLRQTIISTSGWLSGFNLDTSGSADKEEGGSNKLSSLLSA